VRTTRLQVRLRDVHPEVLRVLDVPTVSTLAEVHQLLQAGMGWTDSHLHQFDTGAARYGAPGQDGGGTDEVDETAVPLSTLPASFTYLYDLGDSWEHEVRVLGPGGDRVGCVHAERACPPEDCGGAPGYERLCATLRDPTHPEHEEMLVWSTRYPSGDPVPFDPARVDPIAVDRRVRDTAGQVPDSVRLLLELADGVKLTPGGRIPRVVVRAVHDRHPGWYDLGRPASVEEDLWPLACLHTLLRDVGLLRLRHGVLHTTRASNADLATVRRLRSALPEATFTSLVATTATALLTVSGPQDPGTIAGRLLPEIGHGWARGGRAITAQDTNRPPGVVVSIASCIDRNPIPRAASPRTVSIRCGNDRPNRSSRHTTKVSPARSASNTAASSGRSVTAPDAVSVHVRKHPATLRASCCNAASCSRVETLAYPSSSPTRPHCSITQRKPDPRHIGLGHQFCTVFSPALPWGAFRVGACARTGRQRRVGRRPSRELPTPQPRAGLEARVVFHNRAILTHLVSNTRSNKHRRPMRPRRVGAVVRCVNGLEGRTA